MGTMTTLLSVLLMIALHARSSFSQTAATRDEDRSNLHPGRVILYRPVASNDEDRSFLNSRNEDRPKSDHSRRYTWDRDRTNLPERTSPFKDSRAYHWEKQGNQPYNRDKERDNRPFNRDNYPEQNRPYNRDKERDNRPFNRDKEHDNRPYNRDKERDNRPYNRDKEPDPNDKHRDDRRGFPSDRSSIYRPQRYEDSKLPASKYTNDYFQPPRPTPQKQIQNRNSFLFPGDLDPGRGGFWAHRGAAPYNNVADYVPRERHRFQNNADNAGFKPRPRPGLLQGSIPIPGSGIIVASGPGGVRHVIHDLRTPVHTHVHHNGEKIQQDTFRLVGHPFPTADNNPYSNVNQAYKGVPIFIQGGTFAAKEYDPRFVALYRQVLEENQKKIIPIPISKERTQGGFQSSPAYNWFSEPDPLYHPRNSALLTLPHLQLTTGLAFEPPTGTGELSTSGGLELTSGTASDFLAQLHSSSYEAQLLTTTQDSSELPVEQLLPPTDPPTTGPSPTTEEPASQTTDNDIYRLSSPFVPNDTVVTSVGERNKEQGASSAQALAVAPDEFIETTKEQPIAIATDPTDEVIETTKEQPLTIATDPTDEVIETTKENVLGVAPDPIDEVISTSVSQSVSAVRLTRERIGSNASEILETSHLAQKQETTDGSVTEQTTQDRGTTTATESNEITTEMLSNSLRVETTTLDNEVETSTTGTESQTEGTESTTPVAVEPTAATSGAETTTATHLALTTLNYLVVSLVNQVRSGAFTSDNTTTTPLPTSEDDT